MTAKIYPFPKLHRRQLRALLSGRGDPGLARSGPSEAGAGGSDARLTEAKTAAPQPAEPGDDH